MDLDLSPGVQLWLSLYNPLERGPPPWTRTISLYHLSGLQGSLGTRTREETFALGDNFHNIAFGRELYLVKRTFALEHSLCIGLEVFLWTSTCSLDKNARLKPSLLGRSEIL